MRYFKPVFSSVIRGAFVSATLLAATGCSVDSSDGAGATDGWEGQLQVLTDEETSNTYYLETDSNTWLKLRVAEGDKALDVLEPMRSGRRITVHGTLAGDTIEVSGVTTAEIENRADALTVRGARRLLVIVGSFAGTPDLPVADINRTVFGSTDSVKSYFTEASFGQLTLNGRVVGPVRLSGGPETCDSGTWQDEARAAVQRQGVDIDGFQHVMLVFPSANCPWAGVATLGGSRVAINGFGGFTRHAMVHELGHNFGLGHANLLECRDNRGAQTREAGTCTSNTYADPVDPMGNRYLGHFGAFNKERLGWLSGSNVATVSGQGRFTLKPIESSSTGIQSLRIPRSDGNFYALEFRQRTGHDRNLASTLVNGVLVRVVPAPSSTGTTDLIDMSNSTSSANDATLLPGQTFGAPKSRYKVKVVNVSASGATVEIMND